jgi:hypothetical protein
MSGNYSRIAIVTGATSGPGKERTMARCSVSICAVFYPPGLWHNSTLR